MKRTIFAVFVAFFFVASVIGELKDKDKEAPCFPRVFQTDLVMLSTKCDTWGMGRFLSDSENKVQRLDLNNTDMSITLIYRFDRGMLHVIHGDEEVCETMSLKGIEMPPPCLDKSSKRIKTVVFGMDTKADVWESTMEVGEMFNSKVAFDQKPISRRGGDGDGGGDRDGFSRLWKQTPPEDKDRDDNERERVPISMCLYNKYTGAFFHQFTDFKKMDKLDQDMFEPPEICTKGNEGGDGGDEGGDDKPKIIHASQYVQLTSIHGALTFLPSRFEEVLGLL